MVIRNMNPNTSRGAVPANCCTLVPFVDDTVILEVTSTFSMVGTQIRYCTSFIVNFTGLAGRDIILLILVCTVQYYKTVRVLLYF